MMRERSIARFPVRSPFSFAGRSFAIARLAREVSMRLLLIVLAAAALAPAAPASAQIVGRPVYEPVGIADPFLPDSSSPPPPIGRELRQIRQRINHARDAGLISRREARQMRREARAIGLLGHRYSHGGLSDSERRELQTRTEVLRESVGR
jgi:hypothetical protein